MKQNLQTKTLPFPVGLMSSARNPATMGTGFARELRNLYTSRGGAGAKRNGFTVIATNAPATLTTLMPYMHSSGDLQILAGGNNGSIYLLQNGLWNEVYSGLNILGKLRWVQFAGKLVISNGLDDLIRWDGTHMAPITQWVDDIAPGLSYVDAHTVTIHSTAALYPTEAPVRLSLGVGQFAFTRVTALSAVDGVLTLTLADPVATDQITALAYQTKPPRFQYIYAAHDKLWGMGEGALKAQGFSASATRTTVFYTDGFNDETAWYNPEGTLPFINLADKMQGADALVGMAVKDGITAFFGQNTIQLWAGDLPGIEGNFSWQKNIPVGAIHGDLICEMPADVAFFTRFGVRTLSRVLQTEQLDIGDLGAEIDPSINGAMLKLMQSDTDFHNAHHCRYDRQGWFAFKVADQCFVFQATANGAGWTEFDGLFKDATAFMNAPSGQLYLAAGHSLYIYDEMNFSDNNAPITLRWWTPWLTHGNSRWANKYLELITEAQANTTFHIKRFKNYDGANATTYDLPVPGPGDYWDKALWDNTQWDKGLVKPTYVRDSYIADAYAYIFENTSTDGPIQILGLRIHGKEEQ